jgi:hypothetical protein
MKFKHLTSNEAISHILHHRECGKLIFNTHLPIEQIWMKTKDKDHSARTIVD